MFKFIFITLIGVSIYSIQAGEGDCQLPILETSIDNLFCEARANESDCECIAKKYSSIVPVEKRLSKIEEEMGNALKNSLEQGLYEIFYSSKELSLSGYDLLGNSEVKRQCSLDNLLNLTSTCEGVDERVKRYVNTSFDKFLADTVHRAAKESEPLNSHFANSEVCLSPGEVKRINNSQVLQEGILNNENLNELISNYFASNISFSEYLRENDSNDLINTLNVNPVLKKIISDSSLSKLFIPKLKSAIGNKNNFNLDKILNDFIATDNSIKEKIAQNVSRDCENLMVKVSTLICDDVKSAAVGSKLFNNRVFQYDPSEFEPQYDSEAAIMQADFSGKEVTTLFANHIFYCQGQVAMKNNICEEKKNRSNPNCFLKDLEYDFGDEIYSRRTDNGESSTLKVNEVLNTNFCKLAYCSNTSEILTNKNAKCENKNPPLSLDELNKNLMSVSLTSEQCRTLAYSPLEPCPGSVLKPEFLLFMDAIKDKNNLFGEGQIANASRLSPKTSTYNSFSEHFFGNVGKKIEESQKTGVTITFEEFKKIKPVVTLASANVTAPKRETQTDVTPVVPGKVSTTTATTIERAPKVSQQNNRETTRTSESAQTPVREMKSESQNDGVTYEQYMQDLKTLEDIGDIRERMGQVQGQLAGMREGSVEKEELRKRYEALANREQEVSAQVPSESTQNTNGAQTANGGYVGMQPFRSESTTSKNNKNVTKYQPKDFRSDLNKTTQRGGEIGTQKDQPEVNRDDNGMAKLPDEASENAGSLAERGPASVGGAGAGGAGGSSGKPSSNASSNSSSNLADLPYTGKQADESTGMKIVEVEKLDGKINLANLLREKGISLDMGMPFKIVYEGLEMEFAPDTQGNGDVKYVYRAIPRTKDSDTLFSFLQQAPYWFKDRVESSGLREQINRLRN